MPEVQEKVVMRKVTIRLIPYLAILYLFNCIDRSNVSMAALTMNESLQLTATTFGIGSGIFFFGYVFFDVPSNILLERFGARIWIARIMISWGLVSAATGLIMGAYGFYTVRLLLGIAEAGFFPGIIFYLTLWFPSVYRARVVGLFMISMPLSSAIGAPISSVILTYADGMLGLEGWRWLFIAEGLPAAILGISCLFWLTDRPSAAKWLEPAERTWLENLLRREQQKTEAVRHYSLWEGLTNGRVMLLCVLFLFICAGLYGGMFWIPQVLKSFGLSDMNVGLATAIPYALSVVTMYFWARHSDARRERAWHLVGSTGLSALGFAVAALWLSTPWIALAGLSLACIGIYATLPVFWTLPTAFLTGRASAGAIALITAFANFSGIFVPPLVGWSKDATGGFAAAMLGLAVVMILAAILCLFFRDRRAAESDAPKTLSTGMAV